VQQDVLKRLDKAFDAFFRRVKNGETAGYPRFKSGDRYDSFTYPQSQGLLCLTGKCPGGDRYDSFTYPQSGYEIISNRLHLSKIGHVKIKLHRQIKGKIKTCTIKREGDQWFAIFATEYAFDPASVFHPSREAVGIDLGVKSFAVLSDGTAISNPRHSRHAEVQIQAAHQKIHRRKKGSHRRARAKKELSRLYRKVRHRRRDFLHQQSHKLARAYGTLVFEDLQITNLTARPKPKQDENGTYLPNGAAAKGGLNKSILDGGWRQFVTLCSYKAEEAGARLVKVPPRILPKRVPAVAASSRRSSGSAGIRVRTVEPNWTAIMWNTRSFLLEDLKGVSVVFHIIKVTME
jgi:putative transposase